MVLHNSKWDKKAKSRYYKKHGLTPEWVLEKQAQQQREQDGLESNTWRFQDPENSEEEREEENRQASENINGLVDQSDYTIGQAALRPINEKVEKEVRFFPSEVDDDDEEYKELVYNSQKKYSSSMFEDGMKEFQESKQQHIQHHDNPDEFHKIQDDIERDKMAKDLRMKFQTRKSTNTQHESEMDIDSFLDDIDGMEQNNGGKKKNNEWLDDLLD